MVRAYSCRFVDQRGFRGWGGSWYIIRMNEGNTGKHLEVVGIEGEKMGNAVGEHDGDQAGIMNVLAFDLVGADQITPMVKNGRCVVQKQEAGEQLLNVVVSIR